jgi:hypothetical protein
MPHPTGRIEAASATRRNLRQSPPPPDPPPKLAAAAADLEAERARADKAISAFADLAVRLDELAAERSRPWWKRLVG